MKIPGPDHPITIAPHTGRVQVFAGGRQIADTANALILRESTYPPVYYVPRSDADMSSLAKTEKSTYCPYKGDASYFTIKADDGQLADAVWSYETPFEAVGAIAGYLAFYANKVRIEVE